MEIHALRTGTVRVTQAFLAPPPGRRRQLSLFLPSPFSDPLPIHCWVLEHQGRRILIDTGETATAHDVPFARFEVSPSDELPAALRTIGLGVREIDTVILTHMHGDHMDGAVHLNGPVLVTGTEIAYQNSAFPRLMSRLSRQPIPAGVDFQAMSFSDGPFGAFPASRRLSEDGRIVAVPTPGHTPGHQSIICIDDEGRHVIIAGDATDSLEQLRSVRVDAIAPKPAVHRATMERILTHAHTHPTVYLPSHDPEAAERLARGELI